MTEDENVKCNGHNMCNREPYIDGLCKFHLPSDHPKVLSCDDYNKLLVDLVKEAEQHENGVFVHKWHGFNFPEGHVLFDFRVFHEVEDRLTNGWFNIEYSNIQDIQIHVRKIRDLILTGATIHGDTMIPVCEVDRISIGNAKFKGKFHCASETSEFDARGAVFDEEFSLGATIKEIAVFVGCRFNQSCIFFGRGHSVFGSDDSENFKVAGFDGAIFRDPTHTTFQDVDLRRASFKGVSLVGVRFYSTNFYQPQLKRNGLYNEIQGMQKNKNAAGGQLFKKPDEKHVKHYRYLIHEYRQLRMAMEISKDYTKAHDFYIGEMEARQNREWSFILALYRFCSYYGVNYVRAFIVLSALIFAHLLLTVIISSDLEVQNLFCGSQISDAWRDFGDIALHSLKIGTLQRAELLEPTSFFQQFFDILFRLLIPAQTAMFILALRNKTKR